MVYVVGRGLIPSSRAVPVGAEVGMGCLSHTRAGDTQEVEALKPLIPLLCPPPSAYPHIGVCGGVGVVRVTALASGSGLIL